MNIKDSYNLVVYGDSISRGIVYDSEKSRYEALKNCFTNIVGSKIKGTVYNAGKFGNTIIRGISRIYNDVLKKSPDIVLIEFGGNDCDFNWASIAEDPDTEHKPNTDILTFRETLFKMIDFFREKGITPILMTLPPLDSDKYFKWVSKGDPKAEQNILHWLGSEDTIFDWHSSYNKIIADVASKSKTVLIDVRAEFLKYKDYTKFLCVDGIHPNVDGHSLIANTVLSFLNNNYGFLIQK